LAVWCFQCGKIAPDKIAGVQKSRALRPEGHERTKKKKPGNAGLLFDE
jgi:hypothetical protein